MATLITGVSGQDGSYLAEALSTAGPLVGVVDPRQAIPPYIEALQRSGRLDLLSCDLADTSAWRHLLRELRPRGVFHLAAISAPREAGSDSGLSRALNVASVEALLEWMRRDSPETRALVVSSAAIFGAATEAPQSESTAANPQDEYGRQKLAVRELAAQARTVGLYAACAIPFNHESPRRDDRFVFAKVCRAAVRIAAGSAETLRLGNLDSRRDWGYAPEYVAALADMLAASEPHELVLATGQSHSVRELVDAAFACAGVDPAGRVVADFALARGADYDLVGDAGRAAETIGWRAQTRFGELVRLLVESART